MTRSRVELQDLPIDMDEVTELQDSSVFRLKMLPSRFYELDEEVLMKINFELNID